MGNARVCGIRLRFYGYARRPAGTGWGPPDHDLHDMARFEALQGDRHPAKAVAGCAIDGSPSLSRDLDRGNNALTIIGPASTAPPSSSSLAESSENHVRRDRSAIVPMEIRRRQLLARKGVADS